MTLCHVTVCNVFVMWFSRYSLPIQLEMHWYFTNIPITNIRYLSIPILLILLCSVVLIIIFVLRIIKIQKLRLDIYISVIVSLVCLEVLHEPNLVSSCKVKKNPNTLTQCFWKAHVVHHWLKELLIWHCTVLSLGHMAQLIMIILSLTALTLVDMYS